MEMAFNALVLGKHQVNYFRCPHCGFLQTDEPYWLGEAYHDPINAEDTGLLSRNIFFSEAASLLLYYWFDKKGKYLDYAGGYGVFTRLMRDIGFDFYWHDPMTQNLLARGFEYRDSSGPCDLLTCFESVEHFADPLPELKKMLAFSNNILFSTFLLPAPVPASDWWYYQFEHGQHVSFYSKETLQHIAKDLGLNFYSYGFLHLFTAQSFPNSIIRWIFRLRKLGLSRYVRWNMKTKMHDDFQTMRISK